MTSISEYQDKIYNINVSLGWYENDPTVLESLMLIVTEVAEAAEDFRNGNMITEITPEGKPIGFPSELADVVIRCLDLAQRQGIDLEFEIDIKLDYNKTREYRHGGKRA